MTKKKSTAKKGAGAKAKESAEVEAKSKTEVEAVADVSKEQDNPDSGYKSHSIISNHESSLVLPNGVHIPANGKVQVGSLNGLEGHSVFDAWLKAGIIELS